MLGLKRPTAYIAPSTMAMSSMAQPYVSMNSMALCCLSCIFAEVVDALAVLSLI